MEQGGERLERILRRLLTRRGKVGGRDDCPNEEDLASYLEGSFAGDVRNRAEVHLADCSFCLEEAISAYQAAQASHPQTVRQQLVEKVLALIPVPRIGPVFLDLVVRLLNDSIELVSTSGRSIPTTVPIGIRGKPRPLQATLLRVEKEMGKLKVAVEVERVEAGLCAVVVRVEEGAGRAAEGIRLTLFSGSREQASYLTRQGETVFDRIRLGNYNLAVLDSGVLLGTIRLRIME